jgi:hypothetical protein
LAAALSSSAVQEKVSSTFPLLFLSFYLLTLILSIDWFRRSACSPVRKPQLLFVMSFLCREKSWREREARRNLSEAKSVYLLI